MRPGDERRAAAVERAIKIIRSTEAQHRSQTANVQLLAVLVEDILRSDD